MAIQIHHITTTELGALAPYRTLKRPEEHQKQGIFIAEGEKVVRRLLQSSLTVLSILLTEEWYGVYRPLIELHTELCDVFIADKELLESIVGFQLHKGIMALGNIPQGGTLHSILRTCKPPFLLVAVDGIMNSENLGVIVRNCASFGVDALLVGETSCDPYMRRSVRNSMGTIFDLPVVYLTHAAQELAELRSSSGVEIIAAHPRAGSAAIDSVNFTSNCCIVLGSEGGGISETVLAVCDAAVTIPMQRRVDSLNVASASAVILYEVCRQRARR